MDNLDSFRYLVVETKMSTSFCKMKSYDIDRALELTGSGRYQILLTIICGLGIYAVNSEVYGIGYILPAAQCDLDLDTSGKSLLTSVTFLGIITTQYFWGYLADTRGRRNLIIYTLFMTFISTTLSSFAPQFWLFATLRFFSGIFISASSATIFVYLGEFLTSSNRSGYMSAGGIFVGFAIVGLPSSAWLIISHPFRINILNIVEYVPWRLFIFCSGFMTLISACTLCWFPETPKFLAQIGKLDECLEALKKMHRINRKKEEDYPVKAIAKPENSSVDGNEFKKLIYHTLALFNSSNIQNTFVCCILQFGCFASSSGLLLWYSDILENLAANSYKILTVCQAINNRNAYEESAIICNKILDSSVFTQNLYIGFAYVIGFLCIGFTIQKMGAKNILCFLLVIGGLSMLAVLWVTNNTYIDILFILLLVLPGLCVTIINVIIVDLYPTQIRAMAISMAMLSGRIGSVVSSSALAHLLAYDCKMTFLIYTAGTFGCAVLTLFLPKGEKSKYNNESVKV